MKNIHVLPTEKPSELYINMQGILSKSNSLLLRLKSRHIYITSDEEIKEGDWFTDDNNSLKTSYKLSHVQFANPKKIILTTDQDLIKDGVQAIDDEFLEWFVKNPSCEYVEVKQVFADGSTFGYTENLIYKILIPKEEHKQDKIMEESAENYINNDLDLYESLVDGHISYNIGMDLLNKLFIEGAKWQQEQDKKLYSEEEVYNIVEQAMKDYGKNQLGFFDGGVSDPIYYNLKKWFEQFKKK
jgi:hypothetical protein